MRDSHTAAAIWRAIPTGIAIRVRLTPRSQCDSIDGLEETTESTAIKARVRAIPESGAANAALEKLVAAWLGVSKSSTEVIAGGKSRLKTVAVSGNPAALQRQLTARLADMNGPKRRKGN